MSLQSKVTVYITMFQIIFMVHIDCFNGTLTRDVIIYIYLGSVFGDYMDSINEETRDENIVSNLLAANRPILEQ
jgi:hypothetical protein